MSTSPPVRATDLKAWLEQRAGDAEAGLLLGGTGHLLLSAAEEDNVIRHLEGGVLPRLVPTDDGVRVALMTGLAPGADMLLARTIGRWLRQHDVQYQMIGLLPVPPEALVRDWKDKMLAVGLPFTDSQAETLKSEVRTLMSECHHLIDLATDGAIRAQLDDPTVRQTQYRRLAAILAEQVDVLIAVLRGQSLELPGGTAEVVEWRRHPRLIPRDLSTFARMQKKHADHRRQLVVIDPSTPYGEALAGAGLDPAEAIAQRARDALKAGNYLQCYDVITRARERGVDSRTLQYLTILALANAGSARLALRRYGEFEQLGTESLDEDWLALKGRLLKDLAFRGGPDADSLFLQSAKAYEAVYQSTGGHFSGVNAASMYCLGGHGSASVAAAREVLRRLHDKPAQGDQEEYFWHASQAEASLLLGNLAACEAALDMANQRQTGNVNVRSRTRFQLREIIRRLGHDERILERLALPPVVCLQAQLLRATESTSMPKHHEAALREEVRRERPLVFLGLTGPLELRAAEICLEHGAPLYVSLAAARAVEIQRWRHRHGDELAERLARCIARAHEVSTAHGFIEGEDRWCMRYVDSMAFGLSALAAKRLATGWRVLRVADGVGEPLLTWQASPPLLADASVKSGEAVPAHRRYVGLIFADFVGFSALSDAALPIYWKQVMGAVAEAMRPERHKILFRHTWGDALHVVTEDAESAASIATSIRFALGRMRSELGGELAHLELRLSAHYAPVFMGQDPVEDTLTYFGTQLSFAARIEPVTPPGVIFVTESFAARLMLEAPDRFALEYAGELELAKNFGKYRLFSLRRV
jgi:class 3 adenylate cyclase